MAKASKKLSTPKAPSAPVTSAPEPVVKAKRARKPAIVRAGRLAALIAKNTANLTKNANRWQGSAKPDQFEAIRRVTATLVTLGEAADEVSADIAFLVDSGFTPAVGSPGRKPMFMPGAKVAIKEKRYDASAHGATNVFDVVTLTEKYVQIRAAGVARAMTFPVSRKWLTLLDAAEDELEALPEDTDVPAEDVGETDATVGDSDDQEIE
jgi:hypothetical protein